MFYKSMTYTYEAVKSSNTSIIMNQKYF